MTANLLVIGIVGLNLLQDILRMEFLLEKKAGNQ